MILVAGRDGQEADDRVVRDRPTKLARNSATNLRWTDRPGGLADDVEHGLWIDAGPWLTTPVAQRSRPRAVYDD